MFEYLNELNKSQYEAVANIEGSLLILAGAGSGKTKTLIYRVAYMIDNGIPPESILLLTFTNKAADEMKDRACKMLNKLGKDCSIEATTFHSFCAKMLRIYGETAGIDANFRIISSAEEADAVDFVKVELGMQNIKNLPTSANIVKYISSAENKRISLQETVPKKYWNVFSYISEIKNALDTYKANANYMNFDDILSAFNNVLKTNENIRERIERRYQYIMVDEYQDTNYAQDEMLMLLRRNNKNVAVVGDDMQSIYGFRGAQVQNIITFSDRMPGCKIITLDTNYRSTQGILNVANTITEQATEGYYKHLLSARGGNEMPVVINTFDQTKETEAIKAVIKEMHDEEVPYEEICVLARTSASFVKLEIELNKMGIPYEKLGGTKFMDQNHIQEVLAVLRLLRDPKDELAWFKILKVLEGVGNVYAKEISEECKDYGYDGLIANASRHHMRAYTSNILEFEDEIRKLSGMDFKEALPEIIDYYIRKRTEATDHMRTNDEANRAKQYDEIKRNREDLDVLMEVASGYKNVNSFLDDLTLNDNIANKSEGNPMVLSTIHSVKGLEFDTVIIMDCTEGLMPSENVENGSGEFNEELRCFYVASTRAKNHLFFMHPENVVRYGKAIRGKLTRYLDDAKNFLDKKWN